jgi:DNA-binding PadR family transcriptional regulator
MRCSESSRKVPRTGYGLVRHLAQSIAYTWPASHSQVYPELAKLREAGLIREGAAAPRGGRVYELTDEGLAEVRRWLRETAALPHRPRRGVAAALLPLAPRAGGGGGRTCGARPSGPGRRWPEFEQIAAQEDPDDSKTRAYRTALELGLHTTRARIDWARARSQHSPAALGDDDHVLDADAEAAVDQESRARR